MKEEIEMAFMDFQALLMDLDGKGKIKLDYSFNAPLEDEQALAQMPEAIRGLYFSDGFTMTWDGLDNEVNGYWNLIAANHREGIKQDLLDNHPGDTTILSKFVPVCFDAPETVIGYAMDGDAVNLWSYSTNDLTPRLLGLSAFAYVSFVMNCLCVENLSDLILNYTEDPDNYKKTLTFIEANNPMGIEAVKATLATLE
ncbi:MAG: hypothetical protein ABJM06_06170 [Gilvibacter sp.]